MTSCVIYASARSRKIMKANRLLSELLLLQARGRISTRELAERMEVSQRTAHRDMESLSAAGVPVIALRGSQGGWELDKGWRTQVPALDEEELRTMLMMPQAADRALNKFIAAMPGALQTQAESIRSRVHVDASGWGPWTEDLSALPSTQEAVVRDRKLTFDYRTRDGRTGARTVDPLGVVCKQNSWYLVAKGDSGIRTYRVSRMANAVMLAQGFPRPARFDLAAYWKSSTEQLESQRTAFRVVLEMPAETAAELAKWQPLEPYPAKTGAPGWLRYTVHFENEGQALFVAMGLGSRALVVQPAKLRSRIRQESRTVLDRLT